MGRSVPTSNYTSNLKVNTPKTAHLSYFVGFWISSEPWNGSLKGLMTVWQYTIPNMMCVARLLGEFMPSPSPSTSTLHKLWTHRWHVHMRLGCGLTHTLVQLSTDDVVQDGSSLRQLRRRRVQNLFKDIIYRQTHSFMNNQTTLSPSLIQHYVFMSVTELTPGSGHPVTSMSSVREPVIYLWVCCRPPCRL